MNIAKINLPAYYLQNYIPFVPSECIVLKSLLIVNVLVIKFSGLFLAIVNSRC